MSSSNKQGGLTRRRFLGGAAAAGLSAAGLYELVDRLVAPPKRGLAATELRREQHVLAGQQVITDERIEVIVPPLHHEVVTAKLRVDESRGAWPAGRGELGGGGAAPGREQEPSPNGLGVTVAWGLPYFRGYVPGVAETHMPIDERASKAKEIGRAHV